MPSNIVLRFWGVEAHAHAVGEGFPPFRVLRFWGMEALAHVARRGFFPLPLVRLDQTVALLT